MRSSAQLVFRDPPGGFSTCFLLEPLVTLRVLATLKRQQLELWMRRLRVELRGWD